MRDSFTHQREERAENQAACSGQRPREFSCMGRVANLSVRVVGHDLVLTLAYCGATTWACLAFEISPRGCRIRGGVFDNTVTAGHCHGRTR
jgi:hypothetical protein